MTDTEPESRRETAPDGRSGADPAPVTTTRGAGPSRARLLLTHEWTLAALAALGLAIALNWGAFADPRHTLPQDAGDPALVAYLIAWGGHALVHNLGSVWQLNAFYPAQYGLAYSDSLLGYAPFALVGNGPAAALLRYNIVFVLALALTLFGTYALARQLGAGKVGAAVAAVAFAVAPWRLAQAGHLQVLSTGGVALALAMLARGHDVRWRRAACRGGPGGETDDDKEPGGENEGRNWRPGWVFAGWLVAAWQLTIGFSLGLVFSYVLLLVMVVGSGWWLLRSRRLPPGPLLAADAVGGVVFAGIAALLARPYLRVLELYPDQRRDAAWIELYSPPLRGLFTAPPESRVWGDLHAGVIAQLTVPGEMTLLPGFVLYALALGGLFVSIWPWRVRLLLAASCAVTLILSLGTNGPDHGRLGYLALLDLPGFSGIRTPGRFIVWATLLLALLAAGGVSALVSRAAEAARWRGRARLGVVARLALLLPVLLVLAEGMGRTPHVAVPAAPTAMGAIRAPYLVLPSDAGLDELVMLWSTDGFGAVVNGTSGIEPTELTRTRQMVAHFPDGPSVAYLRSIGVRTVVVIPGYALDPGLANAAASPIDGLGITRELSSDAVVFTLSP